MMEDNELNPTFSEITSEESASISGGATVANFDLNSYLFILGAGAVFNGGLTDTVRDYAFQQSISVLPSMAGMMNNGPTST